MTGAAALLLLGPLDGLVDVLLLLEGPREGADGAVAVLAVVVVVDAAQAGGGLEAGFAAMSGVAGVLAGLAFG